LKVSILTIYIVLVVVIIVVEVIVVSIGVRNAEAVRTGPLIVLGHKYHEHVFRDHFREISS
jgi:hypothetical protein